MYLVKKGPADPFRGDWYLSEMTFDREELACAKAAELTLQNFQELKTSWEAYGYEWSVFEEHGEAEQKIWEGYRYIQLIISGTEPTDHSAGKL